jgi:hypothetical protein
MIEVTRRRLGYGTALVRHLQALFPDTEIDMGMSTDDGTKLLAAIPQEVIHDSDYQAKQARLETLRAKEAEWGRIADEFHDHPSHEGGAWFSRVSDAWNAMNDEIWELEQELRSRRPAKRLFR